MYEEHIRAAARSMAENMQRSPVPMYGKGLRLPDKGAVIGLLKRSGGWSFRPTTATRS